MLVTSCVLLAGALSLFGDKQGVAQTLQDTPRFGAIVPYKNRELQLPRLLDALRYYDLDVLIVEPGYAGPFNRGWLLNVGADMLMKREFNYTCLILHDVDYVPLENVSYLCKEPTQVIVTSTTNGKPPVKIVGSAGVQSISPNDFVTANGYPNVYEGWGAEDDDFAWRLYQCKRHLRQAPKGLFKHLQTGHTTRDLKPYKRNVKLLAERQKRAATDGLNNLQYVVRSYIGTDRLAWALVSRPA